MHTDFNKRHEVSPCFSSLPSEKELDFEPQIKINSSIYPHAYLIAKNK